jgi:hypothetical protein
VQDCGLGGDSYGLSIVEAEEYRKYQYLIWKIYLIYYLQTKNFAPVFKMRGCDAKSGKKRM